MFFPCFFFFLSVGFRGFGREVGFANGIVFLGVYLGFSMVVCWGFILGYFFFFKQNHIFAYFDSCFWLLSRSQLWIH